MSTIRSARRLRLGVVLAACWSTIAVQSARAQAQPAEPAARPSTQAAPKENRPSSAPAESAAPDSLRVIEDKNRSISLEIASRDLVRADGAGPRVGLVAVAHVGDKSFYCAVQELLEKYEVVLYESVKPPGAGGAGGETDPQRIDSTKAAMQFVAGLIEAQHEQTHNYPTDIKSLQQFAAQKDARLAQFLSAAMVDAWGRPLVYQLFQTDVGDAANSNKYSLISYGADGKTGGEGADADITLADQHPPDPMTLSKEDGLQSQLADALGLKFQLDALEYGKSNWRCSDMAMDEVNRRLQAKGLDFGMIGGTLAGSSFPAKIIKFLLAFMKLADALMEGAIADAMKVMMIELLGDPRIMDQGLAQFGQGFGEVIVEDRNQVVIDDLRKLIEREPQVKSVAILYGAAHMPDMQKRLDEQLGYHAVPGSEHWLTAIKVDLTQSRLSPGDIAQMRTMMKRMMRQQFRLR